MTAQPAVDVPAAEVDLLPTLSVEAATEYAISLGFPGFTPRSLTSAMASGGLAYKLIQNRRHTSRAAVRAWLISGLEQ